MVRLIVPIVIVVGGLYLIKPDHELLIISSASDASIMAAYSLADESVIPKPPKAPKPHGEVPQPSIEPPVPLQPEVKPQTNCENGKCTTTYQQPRLFRLFR